MQQTKTDAEMQAEEELHADDEVRAGTLRAARRFKTSWVELAESLTRVRKHAEWKRWGFESFEQYAKSELRLKQETVDKLTGSYQFLQKRAPAVLCRDGLKDEIPSYQTIDFLRRAEDREETPRDVVDALYTKVIDENVSLPKVKKEFGATVFPIARAEQKEKDRAGIRNVAKRLSELLGETKVVPRHLAQKVEAALEELLAAVTDDANAA